MEKLSRVKKYQDLRDQVQNDSESQIISNDLSKYADKISKLEANALEKQEQNTITNFNNEYLDESINEVKEYNKSRGLLKNEDTTLNILSNLKDNQINFSEVSMEETTAIPSFVNQNKIKEISNEINNISNDLIEDTMEFEVVEEEKHLKTGIFDMFKKGYDDEDEVIDEQTSDDFDEEDHDEDFKDKPKKKRRFSLFADLEEDEDDELLEEDSIDSNPEVEDSIQEEVEDEYYDEYDDNGNKILNGVLIFLIVILLIALGCVIYWILKNKGVL